MLQFGHGMPVPMTDFRVDDGITATLSFRRVPHHVVVPWSAVFAVRPTALGDAETWPADAPASLPHVWGPPLVAAAAAVLDELPAFLEVLLARVGVVDPGEVRALMDGLTDHPCAVALGRLGAVTSGLRSPTPDPPTPAKRPRHLRLV